ncbi:hypothetical protein REPUB_Repub03eG0186700 [Reevesia pubescens]
MLGKVAPAYTKWQKPGLIYVKINFDGALNCTTAGGETGAIIRDLEGYVLGACSEFHEGINNPLVVEAIDATRALNFAADMGCRYIVLEGDALKVVNSLNSVDKDESLIGNLITEGKTLLDRF